MLQKLMKLRFRNDRNDKVWRLSYKLKHEAESKREKTLSGYLSNV